MYAASFLVFGSALRVERQMSARLWKYASTGDHPSHPHHDPVPVTPRTYVMAKTCGSRGLLTRNFSKEEALSGEKLNKLHKKRGLGAGESCGHRSASRWEFLPRTVEVDLRSIQRRSRWE